MSELVWKRSTRCDTGSCVEVAVVGDQVQVRDSKRDNESPVIGYTREQWSHLLDVVKAGGDLDETVERLVDVAPLGNGQFCWDRLTPWKQYAGCLHFTRDEMGAFVVGVRAGKFDHAG